MKTKDGMRAGLAVLAAAFAGAAQAQDRIDVSRGADRVVHGSCVPSFKAVNNLGIVVDYLEIGLGFRLGSGDVRALAFRSRYRGGIERPIAPGHTADLTVQLDLSRPLGAACADIVAIEVISTICEALGKSCADAVSVETGRR